MLSLLLQQHHHGIRADASTSTVPMVLSLALAMVPFVLVVVVALFMGPIFLYFFQAMELPCITWYK